MSTITGTTVTTGITLGQAGYDSPLIVTSTGAIETISGNAIYASGTYGAATVVNGGTIQAPGTSAHGFLGYGVSITVGAVTNSAGGFIAGHGAGVKVEGGAIVNFGTITNTSNVGEGISIGANSTVVNNSGGVISGYAAAGVVGASGGSSITNLGTIVGGQTDIDVSGGPNVITNLGTIIGSHAGGVDIVAGQGSLIVNGSSGSSAALIVGYIAGVGIHGATVVNYGTIAGIGANGSGIEGGYGGITNASSGVITGTYKGIYVGPFGSGAGTATNFGTIEGTGIHGIGVQFKYAGSTLTNAGTISGAGGTAISFGTLNGFTAGGHNLLALEHGYALGGSVAVPGTANTLELLGTNGAVTVSLNSHGLINFGTATFGPANGSTEVLAIANTSGVVPVLLQHLTTALDIIDLTQIGADGIVSNTDTTSDRVTITGSLGAVTLQFDATDNLNLTTSADGNVGTEVTVACFCPGTLIRTEKGDVPVEDLAIGDRVVTRSGQPQPIKWIGRRAYDGRFIAGNRAILPICVSAGALADCVPARDLFLSPEHALYLGAVFVPAGRLVNGATIRQVEGVERLEYFHLELDSHDVIFAEGAAAETFIDCGGRSHFHNSAEFARLHPGAVPAAWEPYEALLKAGEAMLPAIRAGLLERALGLGRISRDPDVYLIVDGRIVRPRSLEDRTYCFRVAAGACDVVIASRSTVPKDSEANSLDPRRLGVPFERVALQGDGLRVELAHDCALLSDGFHADEGSHRWTDGRGALPPLVLACFCGDFSIEVQIGATELHYPLGAPAATIPEEAIAGAEVAAPVAARAISFGRRRSGRAAYRG